MMNGFWAIDLLVLISMILVRLIVVKDHAESYACISNRVAAQGTRRNGVTR